jgi:hypothetical protein
MLTRTRLLLGGAMLAAMAPLAGCETFYENLMTNQELIAADCPSLALEESKIDSNIRASQEGANIGILGVLGMAALEGQAGTDGSATMQLANATDGSSQLASDWTQKKSLISQLRAKKGCT